jgi:hypothetical protein
MRTYRKRNAKSRTRKIGGSFPLWMATRDGDLTKVRDLIASGADVNQTDKDGITPLMICAREGEPADLEIAHALLAAGANPNHQDKKGETPLITAVKYGRVDTMQILLTSGANVNLVDNEGNTPLIHALSTSMNSAHGKYADMIRTLIDARANVRLANQFGHTAIFYATANGHSRPVIDLLERAGDRRPAEQVREGLAVEVHDAYSAINKTAFLRFVESRVGVLPEAPSDSIRMANYIYDSMRSFMESAKSPQKNGLDKSLDKIYEKRLKHLSYNESEPQIIQHALEFVRNQLPEFQTAYASSFIQDCTNAYNSGITMSCPKGIKERILFALSSACGAYADSPDYVENYAELVAILNPPSIPKLVARFSGVCLREGHGTKTSFRTCMKRKLQEELGDHYDENAVNAALETFITEYEEAAGPLNNNIQGGGRVRRLSKKRKTRRQR